MKPPLSLKLLTQSRMRSLPAGVRMPRPHWARPPMKPASLGASFVKKGMPFEVSTSCVQFPFNETALSQDGIRMIPVAAKSPAGQLDKHALLSSHPFFREFDSAIIDRLVANAVTRRVKKGGVLFRKGDPGATLCIVWSGSVRISAPSEQGQDAIFNVIPPGEIFGEIALLDGGVRTADAIVAEDCELLVIARRDFILLIRDHPEIAMQIIKTLCARLRRTSEQVEDIMFLTMPRRLAKALLQLQSGAGKPSDVLRITQRDLSQLIGTSRESVNKMLRDWHRRGWLELRRGGLKILTQKPLSKLMAQDD